MDKLNGIFDQGFSGILADQNSKRKTMPDYMDKLAEKEQDFEPEKIETINLSFEKDLGLTRASELTNDELRQTSINNRHTIEKDKLAASATQLKKIEDAFNNLIYEGKNPNEAQKILKKDYPAFLVKRFFEAKIQLILNKFSYLGFKDLKNEKPDWVKLALNSDFTVSDKEQAKAILNKFAKLDYVTPTIITTYNERIEKRNPIVQLYSFLNSLDRFRRKSYKTGKKHFIRDIDKKESKIRDVDNNIQKNIRFEQIKKYQTILHDFKEAIQSGLTTKETKIKLSKQYGLSLVDSFYLKHAEEIKKTLKFYSRKTDSEIDRISTKTYVKEPFESRQKNNFENMINTAMQMMTNGKSLDEVKVALKKTFGLRQTYKFLEANERKLIKHYGQIGYIFIDSNIYKNCQGNELKEAFSNINHLGKKLIYSLKANSKCRGCVHNKQGKCEKVGLLISNSPIVRSPRSAKRIITKASFLPKTYTEKFVSQINQNGGNQKLISEFTLGMKKAIENEKNIAKIASRSEPTTLESQEGFIAANSYNVDLFRKENSSKIIDSILQ